MSSSENWQRSCIYIAMIERWGMQIRARMGLLVFIQILLRGSWMRKRDVTRRWSWSARDANPRYPSAPWLQVAPSSLTNPAVSLVG